jgi:transcriptional regulator with XRE-family HTH domain
MDQEFLGSWLRERRLDRRLTQKQVGEELGMTRENWRQIERGVHRLSIDVAAEVHLCRVLGVQVADFLRAKGYRIECPGLKDDQEVQFLEAFRLLEPGQQRVLRAAVGLGLPTAPSPPAASSLPRIAGPPGRQG